ncbi:leader peptidase (prepilin peptidase)/N-methyltransferase [Actinomycetospora succinea]|uniref:Leader peptidase (Prepilin peptidase)/N-methyltransferase n=1 Tax=Actinomycetospora succinea TaxID=663603 RepID=A0A4R6UVM3_9PSEU|nr:leader peptidase (prepilin peptidase)/N-methyltransferase [Actinomycetospora succinea]
MLAGLAGGGAGALAGLAVRAWLARMRRGALVPVGPCALLLAALWAVACVLVAAHRVPAVWLPAQLVLGVLVVAGSAVDLAVGRLPDALTGPAALAVLAALIPLPPLTLGAGLLGGVVLGGVLAAVHLAAPTALGAGDVKLAPSLGAPLAAAAWPAPVLAVVLACLGVLAVGLARPAQSVPFGPPLLVATWVILTVSLTGG